MSVQHDQKARATAAPTRYSLASIVRHALTGHQQWPRMWRDPEPKAAYDIVIVGGGGHGLATAYYLAKNHGLTNVAVLEKGYLGNGNIGRNTTIVRSNYLCPENIRFYEHSLKLWEGLSSDLNYNVMLSQRGALHVFHNPAQRDAAVRIAWQTAGVREVINEIIVDPSGESGTFISDTWIATKLNAKLMFDRDIESINYSVDVLKGTVHLMGVAQSEQELEKALAHARNLKSVRRVVNHVILKTDPRRQSNQAMK